MSLLSRLFGGGAKPSPDPEIYKDFAITPQPARENGGWRLAALIEKEIGGESKSCLLIRADTFQDETAANDASVAKAKQVIDEQGERLFG